jgi:hypothetical protein
MPEQSPMQLSLPRFTLQRMIIAVGAAAVVFAVIRWIATDVIQPKEYTYEGNRFISSRRLTSKDFERLKQPKPWYFIEPDPPEPK